MSVRRALRVLLAISIGCVPIFTGHASAADAKPFTRDEAAAIIANVRKVVNPGGIEQLETVKIGGIEQYISIRGRDLRNPILLVIHGGPVTS